MSDRPLGIYDSTKKSDRPLDVYDSISRTPLEMDRTDVSDGYKGSWQDVEILKQQELVMSNRTRKRRFQYIEPDISSTESSRSSTSSSTNGIEHESTDSRSEASSMMQNKYRRIRRPIDESSDLSDLSGLSYAVAKPREEKVKSHKFFKTKGTRLPLSNAQNKKIPRESKVQEPSDVTEDMPSTCVNKEESVYAFSSMQPASPISRNMSLKRGMKRNYISTTSTNTSVEYTGKGENSPLSQQTYRTSDNRMELKDSGFPASYNNSSTHLLQKLTVSVEKIPYNNMNDENNRNGRTAIFPAFADNESAIIVNDKISKTNSNCVRHVESSQGSNFIPTRSSTPVQLLYNSYDTISTRPQSVDDSTLSITSTTLRRGRPKEIPVRYHCLLKRRDGDAVVDESCLRGYSFKSHLKSHMMDRKTHRMSQSKFNSMFNRKYPIKEFEEKLEHCSICNWYGTRLQLRHIKSKEHRRRLADIKVRDLIPALSEAKMKSIASTSVTENAMNVTSIEPSTERYTYDYDFDKAHEHTLTAKVVDVDQGRSFTETSHQHKLVLQPIPQDTYNYTVSFNEAATAVPKYRRESSNLSTITHCENSSSVGTYTPFYNTNDLRSEYRPRSADDCPSDNVERSYLEKTPSVEDGVLQSIHQVTPDKLPASNLQTSSVKEQFAEGLRELTMDTIVSNDVDTHTQSDINRGVDTHMLSDISGGVDTHMPSDISGGVDAYTTSDISSGIDGETTSDITNETISEYKPSSNDLSSDNDETYFSSDNVSDSMIQNMDELPKKCCFGPDMPLDHVPPNDCTSLSVSQMDELYLGIFDLSSEPVRGLSLEHSVFREEYLAYHAQTVSNLKKRYKSDTTALTYLRQLLNTEREIKIFRPLYSLVHTFDIHLSGTLGRHSENNEVIVPTIYASDVEKVTVTRTPFQGLLIINAYLNLLKIMQMKVSLVAEPRFDLPEGVAVCSREELQHRKVDIEATISQLRERRKLVRIDSGLANTERAEADVHEKPSREEVFEMTKAILKSDQMRGFVEILLDSENHYSNLAREQLEKWELKPKSQRERIGDPSKFDPAHNGVIQEMATKLRNCICFMFLSSNGLRYDVFCNMTESEFYERKPEYHVVNNVRVLFRIVKVHKHKTAKTHGPAEVWFYPELWNICWQYVKVWKRPFQSVLLNDNYDERPFFIIHKIARHAVRNTSNRLLGGPVKKGQNEVIAMVQRILSDVQPELKIRCSKFTMHMLRCDFASWMRSLPGDQGDEARKYIGIILYHSIEISEKFYEDRQKKNAVRAAINFARRQYFDLPFDTEGYASEDDDLIKRIQNHAENKRKMRDFEKKQSIESRNMLGQSNMTGKEKVWFDKWVVENPFAAGIKLGKRSILHFRTINPVFKRLFDRIVERKLNNQRVLNQYSTVQLLAPFPTKRDIEAHRLVDDLVVKAIRESWNTSKWNPARK